MERVLVIDDDVELCDLITRYLAAEGFQIESVSNGNRGLTESRRSAYALIVLDVMLPDLSGFDVLRQLRAECRTPVLMLTARGDTQDRVRGLLMGADDYLPKPFDPSELVARIRAILRRAGVASASDAIVVDDIRLDPDSRIVQCNGAAIDVTAVEFDLLMFLMRSAGSAVSRETLMREILGRELSPFDRSIDTHVYNLRRKIGPARGGGERIKGIRGTGYVYVRRHL